MNNQMANHQQQADQQQQQQQHQQHQQQAPAQRSQNAITPLQLAQMAIGEHFNKKKEN